MPDISMCHGYGCSIRDRCYRFTATPTPERQSYYTLTPPEMDGQCISFIPNYREEPDEQSSSEPEDVDPYSPLAGSEAPSW